MPSPGLTLPSILARAGLYCLSYFLAKYVALPISRNVVKSAVSCAHCARNCFNSVPTIPACCATVTKTFSKGFSCLTGNGSAAGVLPAVGATADLFCDPAIPKAAAPSPPKNPLRLKSSSTTLRFFTLLISILIGVLVVLALKIVSVSLTPGLSSAATIKNLARFFFIPTNSPTNV